MTSGVSVPLHWPRPGQPALRPGVCLGTSPDGPTANLGSNSGDCFDRHPPARDGSHVEATGAKAWSQQSRQHTRFGLGLERVFRVIIIRGRQFPRRLKATVPLPRLYGTAVAGGNPGGGAVPSGYLGG
jgi:hypothetical protein